MSIICLSIMASTILLSDEIINGRLKVSKRLFKWIEKRGDRFMEVKSQKSKVNS
ncbi:MAG: hypothetical protein F6K40_10850 [Okeania sp. SIO3I5]|uniref:hypothetical protein n=1 Tax=Okeania sp. SIO3I5 TaxID=2607805 RepID=UPI0013B7BD64|nr:hypothetical protein [Okeania sp. SIO3I5]NEQ36749.1 hypothetical protein [Okeania sp. SIO3I5]